MLDYFQLILAPTRSVNDVEKIALLATVLEHDGDGHGLDGAAPLLLYEQSVRVACVCIVGSIEFGVRLLHQTVDQGRLEC